MSKIVLDIGSGIPKHKLEGEMLQVANSGYYIAIDCHKGFLPHILADAYNLPFRSSIADSIISKAVLEHLTRPQEAVNEIYRVLKPHGYCHVIVPFLHGYHGNSNFEDYYRFTKQGLKYLFRDFYEVKIEPTGGIIHALSQLILFGRMPKSWRKPYLRFISLFDTNMGYEVARGWYGVFSKYEKDTT